MSDNGAPLILLTRPRAASERFAETLKTAIREAQVTICPLMEPSQVLQSLSSFADVEHVVFTSGQAVSVFAKLTEARTCHAWCVGDRTAQAARDIGLAATSASGDADRLVAVLTAAKPEGLILHLRGKHTRGDIARRLQDAGLKCEETIAYEQVSLAPSKAFQDIVSGPRKIVAPLFSPRSARLFIDACHDRDAAAIIQPVCLSEAVAGELASSRFLPAIIADRPDAAALIRAIRKAITT